MGVHGLAKIAATEPSHVIKVGEFFCGFFYIVAQGSVSSNTEFYFRESCYGFQQGLDVFFLGKAAGKQAAIYSSGERRMFRKNKF